MQVPPSEIQQPDRVFLLGDIEAQPWHPAFSPLVPQQCADERFSEADLVIVSLEAHQQDTVLQQLRRNPSHHFLSILVVSNSPLSVCLANGLFDEDYLQHWQLVRERHQQLGICEFEDLKLRVVTWLWLFPDAGLVPYCNPSAMSVYHYPLLACWQLTSQEAFHLLTQLTKRHWIVAAELVSRIRLCPECHSGHVNYLDVCPQCQHADIQSRSSLHCFNCGHVADQDSFRKSLGLTCPNCLQRLRHIGVDYDRPIENQICNQCHSLFSESQVVTQCLSCQKVSAPDDLQARNFYCYELSQEGRQLARSGGQDFIKLHVGDPLASSQFLWLIEWHNQLAQRHGHEHAVVAIEVANLDAVFERQGQMKTMVLLDGLQERLTNSFRVTDACSSSLEYGLLLFLPFTSTQQVSCILEKLDQLTLQSSQEALRLHCKVIGLPAEIEGRVGDWLDSQLSEAEVITSVASRS